MSLEWVVSPYEAGRMSKMANFSGILKVGMYKENVSYYRIKLLLTSWRVYLFFSGGGRTLSCVKWINFLSQQEISYCLTKHRRRKYV